MIVLGFFLGLIIILQIFILISTCRKNYKLDLIGGEVSTLCDVVIPAIGTNMEISVEKKHKKKHKKKKGEKFYADNESES